MSKKLIFTGAAMAVSIAGSVSAATVSYQDTLALTTTNFTDTPLSVRQFDSSLGTLNNVMFSMTGSILGTGKSESLDTAATNLTLNLGATVSASTALVDLGVTLPSINETFLASYFDGNIDFGGTSGVSYNDQTASDFISFSLASGQFAEFIGMDFVNIFISANGNSEVTGAGNIVSQFSTQAGASIEVVYDYTAVSVVPLPASLPLMLAGLGTLAFMRRRKAA